MKHPKKHWTADKKKIKKAQKTRRDNKAHEEAFFRHWDALAIKYPASMPCNELARLVTEEILCEDCGTMEAQFVLAHQLQQTIDAFLEEQARQHAVLEACHCDDAQDHEPTCPFWWLGQMITVRKSGVTGTVDTYDIRTARFDISWDHGGEASWTLEALQRDATTETGTELVVVN